MGSRSRKPKKGGGRKSSSMFEAVRAPAPEVKLRQVGPCLWEIPPSGGMRVPGRIYANDSLMDLIHRDRSPEQVANVAFLPGIVKYSLAMPDIHWGYGFPIGGVAATDPEEGGVISPGGVGYDINCGVRVVRTHLQEHEVKNRVPALVQALSHLVPSGTGKGSGLVGAQTLSLAEERDLTEQGVPWAVERGYGTQEDIDYCEERGALAGADSAAVSQTALERGAAQVGSLGSGNHFLEIDVVDEVYDSRAAAAFGVGKGSVVFQIHCGSRGFGHQVCDDFLGLMQRAVVNYEIRIPDRQLCCVPVNSPEGRRYAAAMACAANFAWVNRHVIAHNVGKVVSKALDVSSGELGWRLIYDVCHNIAKFEEHDVDGRRRRLCVHRKGATRAFPKGHPDVPAAYQEIGQPVLVPGDMGTESYVCCGEERAMELTFGSCCHGAGRVMSRSEAIRQGRGRSIETELAHQGITVRAKSRGTLAEEMSEAYKDVADVVDVVQQAGIARKVLKLRPIGVVKG